MAVDFLLVPLQTSKIRELQSLDGGRVAEDVVVVAQ